MQRASLSEVERLAGELSPQEQLTLLNRLTQRLRRGTTGSQPRDLYGVWRDKFPEDFDIDGALAEIRSGWQAGEPK
jgi:hypothetical protein